MLFIHEIFLSIQGEGVDVGKPCLFIRLHGCPFNCSYCDQPQTKQDRHRWSIHRLMDLVQRDYKDVENVCITGGEPLIQMDEVMPVVYELQYYGHNVSIETSGLIPIEIEGYRRKFKYIMDIKCPSSGMHGKNVFENLLHLQSNDEVVFVISDRRDYDYMKETLKKYPTMASIIVSPVFEGNTTKVGADLVKWMIEDNLKNTRLSIQVHKILNVQ